MGVGSGGMVCHSDHKYRLQRLLLVICQFSESERRGISDCERIFLRPCFEKTGRDLKCVSPHKTPSLIGPLTQPELVEWLEGGRCWCSG